MDLNLTGKVAVVTGASQGIGLAVTRALVAEGARVVAGSRTITNELVALADTGHVMAVPVDLSTPEGPAELVARVEHFGGLDIVVNNVGAVTPRTAGFLAVTDDDWLTTLNLNLLAAVRTTRAAIPYLLDRGARQRRHDLLGQRVPSRSRGHRLLGRQGGCLEPVQGAVEGVRPARACGSTRSAPGLSRRRLWLGETGVAATIAKSIGVSFDEARRASSQAAGGFSTGRFTEPEEVADLVLLLASDRAGNVTGADFLIDGGLTKDL